MPVGFSAIAGVVMDMDGVLWRGNEPLPGLGALFDFLHARRLPYALATNNSSTTPEDYAAKLARLGVADVDPARIVASGVAAVSELRARYTPGSAVHVLGGKGLKAMVEAAGFHLSDAVDTAVVVAGIDRELTYDKLRTATRLIMGGADFIGTNDDATFPDADGLSPGAGSILAALRTATGREPRIMGKPNAPMFLASLEVLGCAPQAALMIGDRLDTDIEGAQAVGMKTALVMTGVTTADMLAGSSTTPDAVFDGLPALLAAWRAG